jgi:hypothetical protein
MVISLPLATDASQGDMERARRPPSNVLLCTGDGIGSDNKYWNKYILTSLPVKKVSFYLISWANKHLYLVTDA